MLNSQTTGGRILAATATALLANTALPNVADAAIVQDRRPLNQTNQTFRRSSFFFSTSGPAAIGRFLIIEQTLTPNNSGQLATHSFDAVIKFSNTNGTPATAVTNDFTLGRLKQNPLTMDCFVWDKSGFDIANPQQGLVSFQSVGRVAAPPARTGRDSDGQVTFGMEYQFRIPETQFSFTALIGIGMQDFTGNEAFVIQNAIQRSDLLFQSSPDFALQRNSETSSLVPLFSVGGGAPIPPLASIKLDIPTIPEPSTTLLGGALFGALMARHRRESLAQATTV